MGFHPPSPPFLGRCPWRKASPVSQGSALADGLPALTGALPQAESLPQSHKGSALADGSPGLNRSFAPVPTAYPTEKRISHSHLWTPYPFFPPLFLFYLVLIKLLWHFNPSLVFCPCNLTIHIISTWNPQVYPLKITAAVSEYHQDWKQMIYLMKANPLLFCMHWWQSYDHFFQIRLFYHVVSKHWQYTYVMRVLQNNFFSHLL